MSKRSVELLHRGGKELYDNFTNKQSSILQKNLPVAIRLGVVVVVVGVWGCDTYTHTYPPSNLIILSTTHTFIDI